MEGMGGERGGEGWEGGIEWMGGRVFEETGEMGENDLSTVPLSSTPF